jgi:Uma2 family endonuclease
MSLIAEPLAYAWVSPENYLASEASSVVRHEYIGGRLHAVPQASLRHDSITDNLRAALSSQLHGLAFALVDSSSRVRIDMPSDVSFCCPDIVVTHTRTEPPLTPCSNPAVIIEVLSAETARINRHEKLFAYQSIESLDAYVLVEQAKPEVTVYRKMDGWSAQVLRDKDELRLDSIGCHVSLDRNYRDVEFD